MTSATSLFYPVEADLRLLTENLKQLVSARHPILYAAAEYLFGTEGKRLRPAIVLLLSRATHPNQEITASHRRLAEITEMIHTASLVHDDVVDESALRRGMPTVHSSFGNRVAVLAGDFLFAQSSWYLANLDNLAVVKLLSQVIMDLAEGEIQQGLNRFDTRLSLEAYLKKSYYKTASLMANSAKAAGVLSDVSPEMSDNLYRYGRHVGLAFQIVDDILDFTASTEVLGKPAGSDLQSGNLTAPVLYAMEDNPYLEVLIEKEFTEPEDLEKAIALVKDSQGIERSRELAAHHAHQAAACLAGLPPTESRQTLIDLTDYVLSRLY
ncbi:solanesyl diphosphate synthase [Desertifilum sp. FACHB-1129]|uniref:Solanesyl diphosphate synthase n=1 Tax=Desertifilum tharense IPPAS B-1220 TaxID=1781255 RepID=A0A1E5QCM8_9CYAN|nr:MULTISPECIES: solanesyl diphosphate synthase [Desertifilum]MDA0211647.1 solanesyl diphosphate synthase [Cyanobacteria bacterium FC1]MBD2312154.1 solanesyl diphosphate synthase [Desertifilum sp. FACHB-1129]MBD2322184.1 solanesyl diphosphate synthase [Desertifilum sp. FACHB-866]MBD2332221.1 solanesyl diphosphate synthase [Desertifilum sp. FACHB-868]OEJ72416.1 solanesyl diphosphate synthase [Desertifilum tharense IPPAS B-1220]